MLKNGLKMVFGFFDWTGPLFLILGPALGWQHAGKAWGGLAKLLKSHDHQHPSLRRVSFIKTLSISEINDNI